MKLKTQIKHTFNIEGDSMDDMSFSVDFSEIKPKKKNTIIIEEQSKTKRLKNDASTRLF